MTIETVQIDSIQLDPANLRRHPERNLSAIKGSLARFGQQRPIVIDSRGVIVAGNGTFSAAKALGWASIQIVRTGLSGCELTAYGIADNRTGETLSWDEAGLADILAALRTEDLGLAEATGFSLDDIARKRMSLEGVLVPVTAKWNEQLLYAAGFREVDCFWRWMNFAGWVAVKSKGEK